MHERDPAPSCCHFVTWLHNYYGLHAQNEQNIGVENDKHQSRHLSERFRFKTMTTASPKIAQICFSQVWVNTRRSSCWRRRYEDATLRRSLLLSDHVDRGYVFEKDRSSNGSNTQNIWPSVTIKVSYLLSKISHQELRNPFNLSTMFESIDLV